MLLQAYEKEVSMIVADNGRDFFPIEPMPSGSPSKRFGLLGIRERIRPFSDTLAVGPALSQGCALHMGVPL